MAISSTNNNTGNSGLSTVLANQASAASQVASNNTNSGSATTRLNANFDTFLTLLTTQLRNQNPLDPLNSEQFTQQITAFSGVEQQIQTNTLINRLITNQNSGSLSSAIGFLNNNVVASGTKADLTQGQAQYTLNSPLAVNATITISDANGQVVRSEQRSLPNGTTNYQFNGRNDAGSKLPDGTYTIAITAQASDGSPQTVTTQISGRVTSVDLSGSEAILTVNGQRVKLSDITSVSTP